MIKTENLWIVYVYPAQHLAKSARSQVMLCGVRVGIRNYERQQLQDSDGVETVGHWPGWCAECKANLIRPKFARGDMVQFDNGDNVMPRIGRIVKVLLRRNGTAPGDPLNWYYTVLWPKKREADGYYHESLLVTAKKN